MILNTTVAIVSSICILLIISAGTVFIGKLIHLPFNILLVIVGFLISHILLYQPHFIQELVNYKIYPDILLFVCLPALIFEAAFTMDSRLLRNNLLPILMLAIPGLFISTIVIGLIVGTFSQLGYLISFLLGAILSTTDSVAVVAIFRELDVPKKLSILVEGESLLNSSTGFITVKTIIFIMLAHAITSNIIIDSVFVFLWDFFGGLGLGLILTLLIGYILLPIKEPLIQISLIIVLAYLSFIIAEKVIHVSGVMSTIMAGVIMASWGRTKMDSSTEKSLINLLQFLAYIVNSLIFLLVGFSVNLTTIINSFVLLLIVIIAMILGRAALVFGLMPIIAKFPNFKPMNLRYQTILWCGGLQGAIGLTLVLTLQNVPYHETLITLVMGAVLFTILVQGSLMTKLIHWFKLDRPPLSDKLAKIEAELIAEQTTLNRVPELQQGGLFSLKIAQNLKRKCEKALKLNRHKLERLRKHELTAAKERRLLYLSCFAEEKYLYYEMFHKGHLSEQTYRTLNHHVDLEIDLMRYQATTLKKPQLSLLQKTSSLLLNILHHFPIFDKLLNQIRIKQIIKDYEKNWGLYQVSLSILKQVNNFGKTQSVSEKTLQEITSYFREKVQITENYLNEVAEQFPEFVHDMQQRFAKRLLLHAKYESITQQAQQGLLPQNIANQLTNEYLRQIDDLGKFHPEKLQLDPHELLRKIPFFRNIPAAQVEEIIKLLKVYHVPMNEIVIYEGAEEDTLYLIMRGVIRVIKEKNGEKVEVATLIAGDFFGELALLRSTKRTATCKAVTPCILYTLNRHDFEQVSKRFPTIQEAITQEAKKRV